MEKAIYIVGPMKLQNSLMGIFLEQATGIKCEVVGDGSCIPSKKNGEMNKKRLVLWDCMGSDLETCLEDLSKNGSKRLGEELLCLFNVNRGEPGEEDGLTQGVKGFFYQGDSVDQFTKGVDAVFNGELWLSRKIMTRYILNNNNRQSFPHNEEDLQLLSPREKEILGMLAAGESNDVISDQLCISRHTVKSHLYNIFKKIHVSNRLQAALWAAKNL